MEALKQGLTPELEQILPSSGWEKRHSPGNFTLSTHFALFHGFLPTPTDPGFYEYSNVLYIPKTCKTQTNQTKILNNGNIITLLSKHNYLTICIGGVVFFSNKGYLGKIFTKFFDESYWTKEMSISSKNSTEVQVHTALKRIREIPKKKRIFLFLNISSTHKPTRVFLKGGGKDSVESQKAALSYSDRYLGKLIKEMRKRRNLFLIICSDHGEAMGENGYYGHRNSHPVVMIVPYIQLELKKLTT